jgi:hypothetical protein
VGVTTIGFQSGKAGKPIFIGEIKSSRGARPIADTGGGHHDLPRPNR